MFLFFPQSFRVRALVLGAIVSAMVPSTSANAQVIAGNEQRVVTHDGAELKSGETVIAKLGKGDEVSLEKTGANGWSLVRAARDGKTVRGWIQSGHIGLAAAPAPASEADTTKVKAAVETLKKHDAIFVEDAEGNVVEIVLAFKDPIPAADLNCLGDLADLQRVTLGVVLDDESLAPLSRLKNLRSLKLIGDKITDGGLVHLIHATELRELALNMTQVSDAGLKQLAVFQKLEKLDLSTEPGPFGMAKVHQIIRKYLPSVYDRGMPDSLIQLALRVHIFEDNVMQTALFSHKGLTNAGLKELTALKSLRELDLGFVEVTDEGVANLQTLINLEHLTLLSNKEVTDEGLKSLKPLKKMRTLVLPLSLGDDYSKEGDEELRKALPDCLIVSKFNIAKLVRDPKFFDAMKD